MANTFTTKEKLRDTHHESLPTAESSDDGNDTTETEKRLVRRIDLRCLPICAWIYLLNYLDRGNIGNAKVLNNETGDSLLQKVNMTATDYSLVVSLFSVAYFLFEVPSNLVLRKYVRPSIWLAFLLFGWGALTLGFAGVRNLATVIVLRFLIGAFEAGFFPGIVLLFANWYRPEERSIRIAFVVASATLAGAFGGVIAYGVGHMNRLAGLEGFRWLSIIEGLVTILSVVPLLLILPDFPSTSKWLEPGERALAVTRLERNLPQSSAASWRLALNPRMCLHYLAYFMNCIPLGSQTFFIPTIVNGLGYTSIQAQLFTVPPWVVGYVVSLLLAWSADHFNARGYHIAGANIVGGVGWLTAALLPSHAYNIRYGCLILAACGAFPAAAPLSAWVTANMTSLTALAVATAINNSVAGLSQLISQWIFLPSEAKENYPTANYICAACSFATALIVLVLRFWYRALAKKDLQAKWYL